MQKLIRHATVILVTVVVANVLGNGVCSQSSYAQAPQQSRAQLYFFTNPGCGPCRLVEPELEQLFREGYSIMKIDTSVHPDWTQRFQVTKTPTVILVSGNQVVGRKSGYVDATTLREWFRRAGDSNPQVVGNAAPAKGQSVLAAENSDPRLPKTVLVGTRNPDNHVEERALQATVRLKVEDPKGSSYATGTVIHYHDGNALVLTCGHVFRDSDGKGVISAEYDFSTGSPKRAAGELLYHDSEVRDIGLVAIVTDQPIEPVPVAKMDYPVQKGDQIFSVGCDHGDLPTIRRTRLKNHAKYDGVGKYDIYGRPVDGRSGGGLFTSGGQLIGVCNAAVVDADEGVYVALDTVHWQIATANLSHLFEGGGGAISRSISGPNPSNSSGISAGSSPQDSRLAGVPVRALALNPEIRIASSDVESGTEFRNVVNANSIDLSSNSELILVLRSKDDSAIMQTWTVDDPSESLVQELKELGRIENSAKSPDPRMARRRQEMPKLRNVGGKDYSLVPVRAQSPR